MKHVIKEYQTSDLVLSEWINDEGKQILHLYLKYKDKRQNYTISFETNYTHLPIDDHYKNTLVETLKGLE